MRVTEVATQTKKKTLKGLVKGTRRLKGASPYPGFSKLSSRKQMKLSRAVARRTLCHPFTIEMEHSGFRLARLGSFSRNPHLPHDFYTTPASSCGTQSAWLESHVPTATTISVATGQSTGLGDVLTLSQHSGSLDSAIIARNVHGIE